jgi:hypothetical protein
MKSRFLVVLALTAGCAAPRAQVHAPSGAASASPAPAKDGSWTTYALPGEGISCDFPGVPVEESRYDLAKDNKEVGMDMHSLAFGTEKGNTYWIAHFRYEFKNVSAEVQAAMLDSGGSSLGHIDQKRDLVFAGMLGREWHGTGGKEKRPVVMRAFVHGATAYILSVGTDGTTIDAAGANRFLDSFEVEPASSFYASPDGRFTLLVPRDARPIDVTSLMKGSRVATIFYVGGPQRLSYLASVFDVKPAGRSPDEIVQAMALGAGSVDGSALEKLTSIPVDGGAGRDIIAKAKTSYVRLRMLVVGERGFQVIAEALDRATLESPDVTRVLESFRWGPPG